MPHAPLTPISGNRPHKSELTPYERGMIVGAQALSHTSAEIGKALNFTKSTVQTTIQRQSGRNNGLSKSRSGRPKVLSDRDRRYIIRHARANPRLTYAQLQLEAVVTCSKDTIYRALRLYGLTNWLDKKRPLLTPEAAYKRLEWCTGHQHWTFEQWRKVI